jgi:DNA-binding HxlR family transcriptional regulator
MEPSSSTAQRGARPCVCPHFHAAVELVGRRWAGAILWTLSERGPHYFSELSAAVPDISDRLLSQRLRELEAEGLVERTVEAGTGARPRVSYSLTDKGAALQPALEQLQSWASEWKQPARA